MPTPMTPVKVGALACQRNSFLFDGFKTLVVSCEPTKNKKGEIEGYEIELQDTILFPEGGGQPSDSGFLKIVEGNRNSSKIEKILVSHVSRFEPSDYFNYIELNRKLTLDEITNVSDEINQLIINFPQEIIVEERIGEETVDEVSTSKIPDDYDLSKGVLRTIHIGDIDSNPCCGTHLKCTSQIGSILILPNQSAVRGSNSRLYFMCGKRVSLYAKSVNKILLDSKNLSSCSETQISEKITRQTKQIQQLNKREQYWIKRLARTASEELMNTLKASGKKRAYFMEEEYGTLELLLQIHKEVSNFLKDDTEGYEIILCGYERQTNTGSLLILSESGEKIANLAANLGSILQNLKGGGGKKGGKWQGKITSISNAEFAALSDYLSHDFASC
ncbi:CIH_collapsed_G0047040.mRNA.1.CDS.1 [Saccharomyces cerevisiae]|nr:CIH_collapsed_G0047040.mRNA.1.CDS.1 [Saccharomyces cerevisiae]